MRRATPSSGRPNVARRAVTSKARSGVAGSEDVDPSKPSLATAVGVGAPDGGGGNLSGALTMASEDKDGRIGKCVGASPPGVTGAESLSIQAMRPSAVSGRSRETAGRFAVIGRSCLERAEASTACVTTPWVGKAVAESNGRRGIQAPSEESTGRASRGSRRTSPPRWTTYLTRRCPVEKQWVGEDVSVA